MEHRVGQLGDESLLLISLGSSCELFGRTLGDLSSGLYREHDDPHEEGDRDSAQPGQCFGRVSGLRFAESRYAVADGLDTGERRASEENARDTRNTSAIPVISPCSACRLNFADSASRGRPSRKICANPQASMTNIPIMKA